MRISCSQWRFSLSPIYERKTCTNLNIEIQNFISIFVFRYSPPWRFCAQICTIANVLIANIMFAVEVLTFTHLRKKNLEKLNIEIQNFISIFVFRYSPLWCFCAQSCTIANVFIANIMFAVEVLTFTHLRKKNLEKIEYRNTEFYFDFRFSIFAPLAFLCSNCTIANVLIANIMFAVEVLTFTHLRKKNLEKFEYRNTEFYFDFVFRYSPPWRFCAQICTIANVLIANIMFTVRFSLSPIYERKTWKKLNIEIQNFISIFVFRYSPPWRFLCSKLYYSERAHCEYHVRSGGSHFHPSTKEKLGTI